MRQVNIVAITGSVIALLCGCSNPQPGPDKTVAGLVLGAGWGAGAGAVVGHQVGSAGEGVAVGSGFGAVAGAATGAGFDLGEGSQLENERKLASLKIQNIANERELETIQGRLDNAAVTETTGVIYQVFFDDDATNLRSGSIANLQVIADSIKTDPQAIKVNVVGHTDDTGSPDYNQRLSEARARNVAAYLATRGISMDQIVVTSSGSKQPVASNTSDVGRQLNRRVDVYISR